MSLTVGDTSNIQFRPADPPTNEWIRLMKPAAELAVQIAETEFVPAEMRHRAEAIAACILFGAELGIGPMVAFAKIDIIKGRPAPKAELGRALALGAGHDLWVDETTNTRVVVCGKRRNSTHVFRVAWTMDDARRAGIAGNPAYAKYPRQMLLARASAELVRSMCPEVLGGITLFSEEAVDIDEADLPVVAAATVPAKAAVGPSKTSKRSRAAKPAAEPEKPPLEAVPDSDEGEGPTEAQTKMAMAGFAELDITDRHDRLKATSAILGHPIASWNNATRSEASTVIDALEKLKAGTIGWQIDLEGGWHITPIGGDELLDEDT